MCSKLTECGAAPGHVHAKRVHVHGRALCTNIVDANLGVGHAAAEARLRVRLVLDLPVAPRRTCARRRSRPGGACARLGASSRTRGRGMAKRASKDARGTAQRCKALLRCLGAHGGPSRQDFSLRKRSESELLTKALKLGRGRRPTLEGHWHQASRNSGGAGAAPYERQLHECV